MSKFIYQALILIGWWGASASQVVAQSPKDTAAWHHIFNELVGNTALADSVWQDSLLQQHLYQGMMILHDSAQQSIAGSYYNLANVETFSKTISNYISNYYPQHREATTAHLTEFWESLHTTNTTITKKLQSVATEEHILIANNYAFLYWASHYELLADTISNSHFDTAAISKTLYNYASERVFTDQSYPFHAQLSEYLQHKNVLYIPNVSMPDTSYVLFYTKFSNEIADGLRQLPPATWAVWKWMLGGLLVGIFVSIIYHQYFWKKRTTHKKDL